MDQLVGMGFEEASARRALEASGGSVEHALNLLLNSQETGQDVGAGGQGGEQIVRLGCSQYSFEVGASACTPIACTLVSAVLASLANGDRSFLDSTTLTDLVFTGVGSYLATMGESAEHLAAEELYNVSDTLKHQLRIVGNPHQGMVTTPRVFESLMADVRSSPHLVSPDQYIGVVLTKPPETVGFVVPPAGRDGQFIFFDSHARPQYGFDGAYLVAGETQDTITTRLYGLFESDLGQEMGADVMTSTYNMFEATVFQLNPDLIASRTQQPPHQQQQQQQQQQQSTQSSGEPAEGKAPEPSAAPATPAEAKPQAHSSTAPAKRAAKRNPGIGMGRVRRDRPAPAVHESPVDPAERELIDAWIRASDLNQFGDPKRAMYAGGTPLFDERTATRRDRYEYIISRHPDRPWAR